jgi:MoaA/NifB/PqqE/SkfB family radical SAM enzyme
MFGITNRCNLSCDFCSRDTHVDSTWNIDSAYAMLAGLARAGVLEVAFGGGEPFAFRGFDELLARLADTTPLALNVTTNGTLLTAARLARLAPALGELRLSIYDDNPWPERVELLASAGVRFGANVLVTPARLALLPSLLERLANLGCRDVQLVGSPGA